MSRPTPEERETIIQAVLGATTGTRSWIDWTWPVAQAAERQRIRKAVEELPRGISEDTGVVSPDGVREPQFEVVALEAVRQLLRTEDPSEPG